MENFNFTKVPTNLFLCLDNNCRSMLFTLIQLSTYYADEHGWFFRTCADLEEESNLSQNLVKATLQTLFNHNLIEARPTGQSKGKKPNFYKVNFEKFQEFEKIPLEDCMKNPLYKINTINYKGSHFKLNLVKESVTDVVTTTVTETVKSDHNIENIDNINNINNIKSKENNIINTIEGKFLELKDISKYIKIFEKDRNKENYDKAVKMIEMASRQKRINTFNLKNQLLALNQMIPTDMKEIISAKPIEEVLLINNENTSSYGIITLKAKEYSMEDFEEENDSMFEEEEEDVFVRLYA